MNRPALEGLRRRVNARNSFRIDGADLLDLLDALLAPAASLPLPPGSPSTCAGCGRRAEPGEIMRITGNSNYPLRVTCARCLAPDPRPVALWETA